SQQGPAFFVPAAWLDVGSQSHGQHGLHRCQTALGGFQALHQADKGLGMRHRNGDRRHVRHRWLECFSRDTPGETGMRWWATAHHLRIRSMQIMITSGVTARTRTWQVSAWMLVLAGLALMVPLMLASVSLYHAVMLKAGQGHWPIISEAVGFVERKEIVARDRFVRQNVDAMARKVGEMQARLLQLEAVSERLGGMAGLKPDDLKQQPIVPGQASGGPLVPLREPVSTASALTLDELNA